MIEAREIITLLLGIGVIAFIQFQRKNLKKFPYLKIFLIAIILLITGWLATNLEHLFLPYSLNIIEHICFMFSSIIFLFWVWLIFISEKG